METELSDRFRGDDDEGLMLTPLLDMFTIILIFLIMSFEAQDKGFEPNKKVDLPKSRARSVFKPAVNIAITRDELLIEKEPAVSLSDGRFEPKHYETEHIPPLVDELEKYYAAITEGEELEGREQPEADKPILLIQADRSIKYESLYLVLRSAALAGFVKYRLAILKT